MDIDLAVWDSVDATEPVRKVPRSSIIIGVRASVVWEVLRDRRDGKLPLEQIDLVKEKDDWLALEPFTVDERFEQHHGFVHLVLWRGLALIGRVWEILRLQRS